MLVYLKIQELALQGTELENCKDMRVKLSQSTSKGAHMDDGLTNSFFIRVNNFLKKVTFDDILWIHADGNYCFIHTKDKKYAARTSLKKLADRLQPHRFIQIHRSFVVQLDLIDKIDVHANMVTVGDKELPIGRVYKDNLFQCLKIL